MDAVYMGLGYDASDPAGLVKADIDMDQATGLYQPFDVAQTWFVVPQLFAVRAAEDLYFDCERVAAYRFIDRGGQVEFGLNLGKVAKLRVLGMPIGSGLMLDDGLFR